MLISSSGMAGSGLRRPSSISERLPLARVCALAPALLSNAVTFISLRIAAVVSEAATTDVAEEATASTAPASADNCCSCLRLLLLLRLPLLLMATAFSDGCCSCRRLLLQPRLPLMATAATPTGSWCSCRCCCPNCCSCQWLLLLTAAPVPGWLASPVAAMTAPPPPAAEPLAAGPLLLFSQAFLLLLARSCLLALAGRLAPYFFAVSVAVLDVEWLGGTEGGGWPLTTLAHVLWVGGVVILISPSSGILIRVHFSANTQYAGKIFCCRPGMRAIIFANDSDAGNNFCWWLSMRQ